MPKYDKNLHFDFHNPRKCHIIVSSDTESLILPYEKSHGDWRFRYDFSSQNPAMELRAGIIHDGKTPGKPAGYAHEQTLHFNSEQLAGPSQRLCATQATSAIYIATVGNLGLPPLPYAANLLDNLVNETKNTYLENGIDFCKFTLQPGCATLRIRNQKDVIQDVAVIAEVRKLLPTAKYITTVSPAIEGDRKFVEQYWDRLMNHARGNGIYWGYSLDRPDIMHKDKPLPYPVAVLKGLAAAPYLPWMMKQMGDAMVLVSHHFKQWYTSTDELQRRLTVALLQDFQASRRKIASVFSFDQSAPRHSIVIHRDRDVQGHYTMVVKAAKHIGDQFPQVAAGTKFTFRYSGVDVEGILLDLEEEDAARGNFVLDVEFPAGGDLFQSIPDVSQVSDAALQVDNNSIAAERQLNAIPEFIANASQGLKDLLLGHPLPAGGKAGEEAVYSEARRQLRTANKALYDHYEYWTSHLPTNKLQDSAIQSCLRTALPAQFVQGAPGSGKSNVAVTCALSAAQLGFGVLVASPTRTAGKANAIKLAKEHPKLRPEMHARVQPIYFPTWTESIERMYEAQGCKPKRVTQPGDEDFANIQLWKITEIYARAVLKQQGSDERAENFLTIFDSLCPGKVVTPAEGQAFSKAFKALAAEVLAYPNYRAIIISTCNNSACIAEMKLKISLLIIDEAAVGTDYDIIVPLQIPHDKVMFMGDHKQLKPVVTSEKANEYYDQACVSSFERILTFTLQDHTLLNISYRFPQAIADPIGLFGGYKALAAADNMQDSLFYKSFVDCFTNSEYYQKHRTPPAGATYGKEDHVRHFHRLAFSIKDAFSSAPRAGFSTINHGNINVGIRFLQDMCSTGDVTDSDIMIIAPFAAQAELWKAQLKIQWPGSSVSVVTVGTCQGNEAKLAMFDMTVAWQSQGAFVGFLKDWNRCNVALSRGCDVVVSLFNEPVMRKRIESLGKQNLVWALYIMDLVDLGLIYDVDAYPYGGDRLPLDSAEYGTNQRTNVQPAATMKTIPADVYAPGQATSGPFLGGPDKFTLLEKAFLVELTDMRENHKAEVSQILTTERAWQRKREDERKKQEANVAAMNEVHHQGDDSDDEMRT